MSYFIIFYEVIYSAAWRQIGIHMRVIAGSARSLQLKTVEGLETRPTTDRIKETLFNVIQSRLPGSRFLDLFSGSGAIGIEALSRGAEASVFVENNRLAVSCIDANLKHTKLAERGRIINQDVLSALRQMEGKSAYDIIFMDPPYDKQLENDVLEYLSHSSILDEDTLIIIEASLHTDFSFAKDLGYTIVKEKNYKTNKHVFLEL